MGIYIRGMKLPNSCDTCPMNWRDMVGQLCCRAESYIVLRKENQERPDWCPLVPVLPHGDLIDRDDLRKKAHWIYEKNGEQLNKQFFWASDVAAFPVVIPAEEQ